MEDIDIFSCEPMFTVKSYRCMRYETWQEWIGFNTLELINLNMGLGGYFKLCESNIIAYRTYSNTLTVTEMDEEHYKKIF